MVLKDIPYIGFISPGILYFSVVFAFTHANCFKFLLFFGVWRLLGLNLVVIGIQKAENKCIFGRQSHENFAFAGRQFCIERAREQCKRMLSILMSTPEHFEHTLTLFKFRKP